MAQQHDRWGLALSAADERQAHSHDELVDAYLTFSADIPQRLHDALEGDAAPLSRLTRGYFMVLAHTAADHRRAAEVVAQLSAETTSLNEREQGHLQALRALVAGDNDDAIAAWGAVLQRWPVDVLALRMQHFVLFNRGRLAEMLSAVQRSAAAWAGLPRRSYLDGMAAFALEEMGRYEEAETLGRAATAADAGDLWSIHSVAHVLEMQGRAGDAVDFFAGRHDELARHGAFARHLWWHEALVYLNDGRHQEVLDRYDRLIQPGTNTDGLSLTNAIDLLARLEFAGVDVGDRWQPLAEPAAMRLGHHDHPFNDSHYAYALARAGRPEQVGELLAGMAACRDRPTTAAVVTAEVGLDMATGMAELAAGRYRQAAGTLAGCRQKRWMLGGSHAQRDLFEQAALCAQLRSGRPSDLADAERTINERIAAKASSARNHIWLAKVLEASGGPATTARQRATELGWPDGGSFTSGSGR